MISQIEVRLGEPVWLDGRGHELSVEQVAVSIWYMATVKAAVWCRPGMYEGGCFREVPSNRRAFTKCSYATSAQSKHSMKSLEKTR